MTIIILSVSISFGFGRLLWDQLIPKTVISLFVYYIIPLKEEELDLSLTVMLACTYSMATLWYTTYLKITKQQQDHIK